MTLPCDCYELLACPFDGASLHATSSQRLACEHGHAFPIVQSVAVLLRSDVEQTIGIARASLQAASDYISGQPSDPVFANTLGLDDRERASVLESLAAGEAGVDPVISHLVGATNGILYRKLIGQLAAIPIPDIRLPPGRGQRLLDVGCNWGRWSMAAAQKGYSPIGIDPSLGAVLAAKRLAGRMGLPFQGVVGDARFLPLRSGSIDTAFSYSVLQHFSKPDAAKAMGELANVVRPGGFVRIQMASAFGLRSFHHMLRRKFREPVAFEVRYWPPTSIERQFRSAFGAARLEVDGFFGLGLQATDAPYYSAFGKLVVGTSEVLRKIAGVFPPLTYVADSLYLTGENSPIGVESSNARSRA